ncbi:MAG: hypothetical protein Q8P72_06335 [Candidatus Roizmanbacteria bacterium]|nr:hypothetical protein [Candidatus Roizmanbacteria bacterium]
MNKNIFKIIFFWFLAHASIWMVFFTFIRHINLFISMAYFASLCLVFIYLFRDVFIDLIAKTKRQDILLIFVSLSLHAITYWICNQYLTAPLELMKTSTASFIQVDRYFIWAKPLDVLLQQVMIILLVTKLHEKNVRIRTIAFFLAVLFGVAHMVTVQRLDLNIAVLMTVFTTLFALAIPYLQLKVRNGYLINFMIHIALVDLAALLFWGIFG